MAENILHPFDDPITLSPAEWREIESASMAFHAALRCGAHLGAGEGEELIVCVERRLSAALTAVRRRVDPED